METYYFSGWTRARIERVNGEIAVEATIPFAPSRTTEFDSWEDAAAALGLTPTPRPTFPLHVTR